MRRFLTLARLTRLNIQDQQLPQPKLPVSHLYQPQQGFHQSSWLFQNNRSGRTNSSSSGGSRKDQTGLGGVGNKKHPFDKNKSQSRQPEGAGKRSLTGHQTRPTQEKIRMTSMGSQGHSGSGSRLGGDRRASETVKLDKRNHRFTLDLGNGQVARIDFKTVGPHTIDMYHTEVPSELRNQGLGKVLASGALRQAANNNMRVKLTCSYLVDYVNKSHDPNSHIVEK